MFAVQGPINKTLFYFGIAEHFDDGSVTLNAGPGLDVLSVDVNGNVTSVSEGSHSNNERCMLQGLVAVFVPIAGHPDAQPVVFAAIDTYPLA